MKGMDLKDLMVSWDQLLKFSWVLLVHQGGELNIKHIVKGSEAAAKSYAVGFLTKIVMDFSKENRDGPISLNDSPDEFVVEMKFNPTCYLRLIKLDNINEVDLDDMEL